MPFDKIIQEEEYWGENDTRIIVIIIIIIIDTFCIIKSIPAPVVADLYNSTLYPLA